MVSNKVPAVRVHVGTAARRIKRDKAHRTVPSRWHEKWKDMGDDFDNNLKDANVAKHLGAKSRWIFLGFHDPDIALLNRTVPTPETSDVPLALQMLASIQAKAWVGDVKSAFTQGIKGSKQFQNIVRGVSGKQLNISWKRTHERIRFIILCHYT